MKKTIATSASGSSLSDWSDIIRRQGEESAKFCQAGREVLQQVDLDTPLTPQSVKILEIVERIRVLAATAFETRGVRSEEEAAQLRASLNTLRAYLNGLQETVPLEWKIEPE